MASFGNNIARDFIDDTENYDDLIQMVKQDITLDNDDDDDDIDDDDTVGDDTVGDTDNKTEDPLDLGSPRDDDIDGEYIEYYIKELKDRCNDINSLSNIVLKGGYLNENIIDTTGYDDEVKNILDSIQERYNVLNGKIDQQSSNGEIFKINNNEWHKMLTQSIGLSYIPVLGMELNDRINDVKGLINMQNNEAKFDDIINMIKARHNNIKVNIEDYGVITNDVNLNNDRWRGIIAKQNDVNTQTEQKLINATKKVSSTSHWLFNNNDNWRENLLENVVIDDDGTSTYLKHISRYLNRILPTSDDLQCVNMQNVYIPILTKNNTDYALEKHVIQACLDGVIFSALINLVEPDFIDIRALNLPDLENLKPLNEKEIKENMAIVLGTLKALNIKLPFTRSVDEYLNPNNTAPMIVSIIIQLFQAMLSAKINIKTHPELIRLCQNDEEKDNADQWEWSEWLRRWLLFIKNPMFKKLKNRDGLDMIIDLDETKLKKSKSLRRTKSSFGLSKIKQKLNSGIVNKAQSPETPTIMEDEIKSDNDEDMKNTDINGNNNENGNNKLYKQILGELDYDWHSDLLMILTKLDDNFSINIGYDISNDIKIRELIKSELTYENEFEIAKCIIKSAKNNIGIKNSVIKIDDIAYHNYFLSELLISELFEIKNKIEKLKNAEKNKIKGILKSKSNSETTMIAWINSLKTATNKRINVTNLSRDLSDGIVILKLLNLCKPKIVKWKKHVRMKCRHKFDKLGNCKYAIDLCSKHFPFSLVGIGGSDIVDNNQKYINTLLYQIMVYHSKKILSDMTFGGKTVKDSDILDWSNKKLKNYKEKIKNNNNIDTKYLAKSIQSFNDQNLFDCLYYINLLHNIDSNYVKYSLVYIIDNKNKNSNTMHAIKNARYVITIIRRLGGELFVMPEDLVRCEARPVLSVITQIMTIDQKYKQSFHISDETTNNNDNNDDNTETKDNNNNDDTNETESNTEAASSTTNDNNNENNDASVDDALMGTQIENEMD